MTRHAALSTGPVAALAGLGVRIGERRQVWTFLLLVGACSLPFWIVGAVTGLTITSLLSVASLMVVAPSMAAVVLTARDSGRDGVVSMLRRVADPRLPRGIRWYLPVVVLMPVAILVQVALLQASGRSVPGFEVAMPVLLADLAVFWLAATMEEVGWTAYLTDRLLTRWSMLGSAFIVGLVWALWHIPAMLLMPTAPAWSWIALQCAVLVAMRIIMLWVYEGSGRSLFAVITLHAVSNVSMMTLFPVYGSAYDPAMALIVLSSIAAVVMVPSVLGRRRRPAQKLGLVSPPMTSGLPGSAGSSAISSQPASPSPIRVSSMISPKPVRVAHARTSSRTLSSKRMTRPRGS